MRQATSPHYTPQRTGAISAIVLHDTGGDTAASALSWFAAPESRVSAHFVIDLDGEVYEVVPVRYAAWHAGRSSLWGEENVNDFSIGIELVDADARPYPIPQMVACVDLCAALCRAHGIWLNRIVGHEHIAIPRGRKVDPGADFPWRQFLVEVAGNLRRVPA